MDGIVALFLLVMAVATFVSFVYCVMNYTVEYVLAFAVVFVLGAIVFDGSGFVGTFFYLLTFGMFWALLLGGVLLMSKDVVGATRNLAERGAPVDPPSQLHAHGTEWHSHEHVAFHTHPFGTQDHRHTTEEEKVR